MGKRGSWFSAVKKALSPTSKEKKDQKTGKSKKKCLEENKDSVPVLTSGQVPLAVPPPLPPVGVNLADSENEQSKHAYSVALATAVAAEAAVAAAQAAAEVVRLTSVVHYTGKSKEEIAATKIQTAFRGYMARRALRALRGLVRLRTLVQGQSVKRQAATTLRCMQTLARLQSEIRSRRVRMSEENQALQRQLQQKQEKELEKLQASIAEDWNDSTQSKEQLEAKLMHKQEAAMRRERALAYAFSHQQMWKNSSKSATSTFIDPNNPHWGWSWLERWMAARPWENRSVADLNDHASVKSAASHSMSVGEITKLYALRDKRDNKLSPTCQKSNRPPSRLSPSTPTTKAPSLSPGSGKKKPPSSKGSAWGGDDDSRSMLSNQSDYNRRHSIAGSSMRDDESLASSTAVPSYMAPTQSAKARSRLSSPSGLEKTGTPEKGSVASAKKRLSFPASPAGQRRHSGPPKMETSSIKDIVTVMEEKVGNGVSR